MARTTARRRGRQRGQIEQLPSGSLRVTVYAGTDPLSLFQPDVAAGHEVDGARR
jgi:hypothetical protein